MSDTKDQKQASSPDEYRITPNNPWSQAWKMALGVGIVGMALGAVGYTLDPRRFAFSYLMGFVTVLTIMFGSMFFVLVQHLTGAGWSVTVRRAPEFFASGAVIIPLLALPNLISLDQLFPWWSPTEEHTVAHAQQHPTPITNAQIGLANAVPDPAVEVAEGPEHAAEEQVLASKTWYLNHGFFFLRAILYLLVWLWLGRVLFGYSTAQDKTGDPQWTVKLQRIAPVATILFAFSLTFAGFDWVMSLQPTWYSTMFGVRIFAASALLGLCLTTLVNLGLRHSGVTKEAVTVEHFHDLGKLTFGFLIFWAYISFGEFFLIWYAAIPEETVYYHLRWDFPWWRTISIMLIVVKFIIPFYLIMSRNAKRALGVLGLGVAWIITLHLVEMYYWIMPNLTPGGPSDVPFSATGLMTDAGCMFGCIGLYLAVVFRRMLNHPVIPLRDPRLQRALEFVNA